MSAAEINWDSKGMRALYASNALAKSIIDDLAGRERNLHGNVTIVDKLVEEMKCDRQHAIGLLRQFQQYGTGRFVTGRRGKDSRFEWASSAIQIAKEVSAAPPVAADNGKVKFVEHIIWLRPGVQVSMRMPEDTSREEAEKVSAVVKNLWLAKGE